MLHQIQCENWYMVTISTSCISRCCFSTWILHLGHGILAWFSSKWTSISALGIGSLQCSHREIFLLQCISCSTKLDVLICLRLENKHSLVTNKVSVFSLEDQSYYWILSADLHHYDSMGALPVSYTDTLSSICNNTYLPHIHFSIKLLQFAW